ncbi:hypothetical protein R2F25_05930 [Streptomyces sp. UP1A-1]|nr:hypothetical protein [Streptomyces sp. UP1A-1]
MTRSRTSTTRRRTRARLNAYWRHEWLLITQGVARDAQDGLFVTCRAGEDYGRVGRYFNEDAPSFTGWTSLRAALSSFAEALERRVPVGGRVPLAFDGELIWEEATPTVKAEPVSLFGLAARTPEPEPAGPAEPARGTPRGRLERGTRHERRREAMAPAGAPAGPGVRGGPVGGGTAAACGRGGAGDRP